MGKIVISSSATLDGVVQDPDGQEGFERGGWFHQSVGSKDLEDWAARETEEALGAEALLLGRRSSEWFASRMPSFGDRVSRRWADRMNSIPKYVVSSTLDDPRWSNTTVLNGDAVKEISELKRKVDGEILVYGSYQLVRVLMEQNLADELRLVVSRSCWAPACVSSTRPATRSRCTWSTHESWATAWCSTPTSSCKANGCGGDEVAFVGVEVARPTTPHNTTQRDPGIAFNAIPGFSLPPGAQPCPSCSRFRAPQSPFDDGGRDGGRVDNRLGLHRRSGREAGSTGWR
jgi:dihydrofolate reductase